MNKWFWRAASFLLTVGLLMGCSSGDDNNDADNSTNISQNETNTTNNATANENNEEDTVKITLSIHEGSEYIDEMDVDVEEGDVLMDLLKQTFEVDEDDGFINSIQGKEPEDDDEAWMIFVNGEMAEKGADELKPSPGDEVLLDLQTY